MSGADRTGARVTPKPTFYSHTTFSVAAFMGPSPKFYLYEEGTTRQVAASLVGFASDGIEKRERRQGCLGL